MRAPKQAGQPDKTKQPVLSMHREAYEIIRELARREDKPMSEILTAAVLLYAESVGYAPRKSRGWKRAS